MLTGCKQPPFTLLEFGMPKRKRDRCVDPTATKHSQPVCILRAVSICDHSRFTPFSEITGTAREKLRQLHYIRARRLCQSCESPYRKQVVCDKIPTILPE